MNKKYIVEDIRFDTKFKTDAEIKDLEWKSKRLHQLPAVIAHRSVNLNAEAIAKFCMLLQILLNGRVGHMGAERLVVGVDL